MQHAEGHSVRLLHLRYFPYTWKFPRVPEPGGHRRQGAGDADHGRPIEHRFDAEGRSRAIGPDQHVAGPARGRGRAVDGERIGGLQHQPPVRDPESLQAIHGDLFETTTADRLLREEDRSVRRDDLHEGKSHAGLPDFGQRPACGIEQRHHGPAIPLPDFGGVAQRGIGRELQGRGREDGRIRQRGRGTQQQRSPQRGGGRWPGRIVRVQHLDAQTGQVDVQPAGHTLPRRGDRQHRPDPEQHDHQHRRSDQPVSRSCPVDIHDSFGAVRQHPADACSQIGRIGERRLIADGRQRPFQVVVWVMVEIAVAVGVSHHHASFPICVRSRSSARLSRDFTVPRGQSSTAAVSASLSSSR